MSETSDLSATKAELRAKLRFRRRHFAANLDGMAALAAFRSLPDPLGQLLRSNAFVVGAYGAAQGEPDILPLMADHLEAGRIALPFHARRDEHMEFRLWAPDDALETGPWSTPQPLPDSSPALPQVILCPLLGFDRHGGRLGQGGGHYDRYFARHSDALRIGISWSVQEIDAVPSERTDIGLDAVLTEQEMIICGRRFYEFEQ